MRLRALSLLVVAVAPVDAQGLRLRIVDDSTGQPVRAWVTLQLDREVFAEGLTRPDGTRFFPADPSASYTVVVQRVGHEPFTSSAVRVPRDTGTVEVRLPMGKIAFQRSDLSRARCSDRLEGLALQLWGQLRVALAVADQTTADGTELLGIRRFERMLGRDGEVKSEATTAGRALGTRMFAAASPAELSRAGFVATDAVGERVYFGPNPSYLLSPEFLADHCFAPAQGRGATLGMLGLRFEQRADRSVPGIDGTLWVDGESGELRLLEFGYRGRLPADARGVGGRVLFDRLPSGSWIARDWLTRTPVETQAGQLLGYRELGGETLVVPPAMLAVADSIENARKPPGIVTGAVIDSLTQRGLPGAIVFTDIVGPRARTDSSGAFSLRSVPAGWRRVSFSHPTLDSLGTRIRPVTVRVGPDSTSNLVLGTPSLATLKGGACHDTLGILTGTVRDIASGTPVDSADVTLSWLSIVLKPDMPLAVNQADFSVTTDSTGRYASCVPQGLEITGFAEVRGARTGRVDVTPDDRRVTILDLTLDRSAQDTLTGRSSIHGVVMYQDRTPIAGATVLLTDPERSVTTDSLGRFRFGGIPGGTRVLATRALGHAPMRSVVTAAPADTASVRVYMRRVTELDAIVVRASAGTAGRAIMELEERRRSGEGYRLTPVDLLGFKYARMDAVVRALPFARVRRLPGGLRVLVPGPKGHDCAAGLFVDGQQTDIDMLELISAREALAVEIFTRVTEVPPRYQTSRECGVILLWTRQGLKSGS